MESFDYVVVGGGTAGAVLAARLSEMLDCTVCLLEAGHRTGGRFAAVPLLAPMLPALGLVGRDRHTTTSQTALSGRRIAIRSGRGLGGSSITGDPRYLRGARADYDRWQASGLSGWGWADVVPHFQRAEQALGSAASGAIDLGAASTVAQTDASLGRTGPLPVTRDVDMDPAACAFLKGAAGLGVPSAGAFAGPNPEGAGPFPVIQKDGRRLSTADAYLRPAETRPNLRVIVDARVERIEIAEGRVQAIRYRVGPRQKRIGVRREIVLAAGTFGSPKLLLYSGIGPGEALQALGLPVTQHLPGVGENLQDRLTYSIGHETGPETGIGLSAAYATRLLRGLMTWRDEGTGPWTSPVVEAGALIRSVADADTPDLQLRISNALIDTHMRQTYVSHGVTADVALICPSSRGSVTLASPRARAGLKIDPGYFADRRDLRLLVRGTRLLMRLMSTHALENMLGECVFGPAGETDMDLEFDIRNRATSLGDPVGTCAMGPDHDPMRVTDARLRVPGVIGLRIADGSVMPSYTAGCGTAPVVLIAEKAAEMIKEDAIPRPAQASRQQLFEHVV